MVFQNFVKQFHSSYTQGFLKIYWPIQRYTQICTPLHLRYSNFYLTEVLVRKSMFILIKTQELNKTIEWVKFRQKSGSGLSKRLRKELPYELVVFLPTALPNQPFSTSVSIWYNEDLCKCYINIFLFLPTIASFCVSPLSLSQPVS